jgi:gluconolactonase
MPIEQHHPALTRIVSLDQKIEELATGFGGDLGPAEGPVWWKEGGYLLLSDIGNNRRMKWAPREDATLFQEPTNQANGLTRDRQGRLIACEHLSRRVTRQEPDGSLTVVANRYHGRRLNRPNDVVVKSDGSIYFTDPGLGAHRVRVGFLWRVSRLPRPRRDPLPGAGFCIAQRASLCARRTPPVRQ